MIPLWAVLALVAALFSSFNPIIYSRILRDADVALTTWVGQVLSLPLLAFTAFFIFQPLRAVDVLFIIGIVGSAILNVVAHLASNRALQIAEASLVTPFLNFNPLFATLVAMIALQEFPTVHGVIGVLLVIIGANLVHSQRDWRMGLRQLVLNRGISLTLLASFIWGVTPIFEKIAIQHTQPTNPPLVGLGSTLLLGVFLAPVLCQRTIARIPNAPASALAQIQRHWRGFVLLGLIGGITPIFALTAFSLGNVGYVTALFKLSTTFTLVWSRIWLNEREVVRRLPGTLVMVIGAIVISA